MSARMSNKPARQPRPTLDSVLRRAHLSVSLIAVLAAGLTLTAVALLALRVYSDQNLRLVARSMSSRWKEPSSLAQCSDGFGTRRAYRATGRGPCRDPQAPPGAAPTSVVAAQAAPPSTPAARPGAPEVARTSAPIPQPNEVTTDGTEREGATSQLEEPSSGGGSATTTGTLAAVLAGLAGVLGVTAIRQWVARRRG